MSKPLPIALLDWRPVPRNSLRGFAKIRLGNTLIINDVALHCSHGRRWAQAPSKPVLDRDGNPKRDDKGKIQYVPIVEWTDRGAADLFSESMIAAVEAVHPGATEGDWAP